MWAGGRCISGGYVNMLGLTSQRFKLDNFSSDDRMIFNTGDLGRWTADGALEHLGGIDDQVKIKGFRVELDGVAAAMENCSGVDTACAILNGQTPFGCYSTHSNISVSTVQAIVHRKQSYYAVPSQWRAIPTPSLTANGKVDKKALVTLVASEPTAGGMPAVLELAAIFSKQVDSYQDAVACLPSSLLDPDTKPSPASSISEDLEKFALTPKRGIHGERGVGHRFLTLYRCLFSCVFIANLLAIAISFARHQMNLQNLASAATTILAVAVLMRQDHVINALFKVCCLLSTSAPMFIMRNAAKVYHVGGIHSSAAVASFVWFVLFTAAATRDFSVASTASPKETAILVISYSILVLFCTIMAMAYPTIRGRMHNRFEIVHRFAGWTTLGFLCVQTLLVIDIFRGQQSLGIATAQSAGFWLQLISSFSVIYPWLHLRRVSVKPEILSNYAVRLHFQYATPICGTAVSVSERPLIEWHAFATIAKPGEKGFSVVVSNAGDWTKRQIERAPTTLWVRGVPTCGVLRIAPLFKRIVLVATGSGIGPCLPVVLAKQVPCRIFWSTPNPEITFGKKIIHAVKAADSKAVIHNTRTEGKPDMVAVTFRLFRESRAEAVCIISNQKMTQKVVYAMESRAIPAHGAIWDS